MKIATMAGIAALACWLAPTNLMAQAPAQKLEAPAVGGSSIEVINAAYERDLLAIERRRLASLGDLAVSQPREQAVPAYDACFRLAISRNLYADALPYAAKVVRSEAPHSGISWLAHLVYIVGEADRGAFEESLKALGSVIGKKGDVQAKAANRAAALSPATQASILDGYYQRLIQADQIDVARRAMTMIVDNAEAPAIRDLAARRLKQLELIGKSAPEIAGLDLDGKPFKLSDAKGDLVLVVFWATWCLPNAQQMPYLDYLDRAYRSKGLKVVGINLDAAQDGDPKSVLPNIHRYLLEYNVTWPTLLNGQGTLDHATAYGVTEIPASVLIGRDGKVSHLDLVGRKLEATVAAALAKQP